MHQYQLSPGALRISELRAIIERFLKEISEAQSDEFTKLYNDNLETASPGDLISAIETTSGGKQIWSLFLRSLSEHTQGRDYKPLTKEESDWLQKALNSAFSKSVNEVSSAALKKAAMYRFIMGLVLIAVGLIGFILIFVFMDSILGVFSRESTTINNIKAQISILKNQSNGDHKSTALADLRDASDNLDELILFTNVTKELDAEIGRFKRDLERGRNAIFSDEPGPSGTVDLKLTKVQDTISGVLQNWALIDDGWDKIQSESISKLDVYHNNLDKDQGDLKVLFDASEAEINKKNNDAAALAALKKLHETMKVWLDTYDPDKKEAEETFNAAMSNLRKLWDADIEPIRQWVRGKQGLNNAVSSIENLKIELTELSEEVSLANNNIKKVIQLASEPVVTPSSDGLEAAGAANGSTKFDLLASRLGKFNIDDIDSTVALIDRLANSMERHEDEHVRKLDAVSNQLSDLISNVHSRFSKATSPGVLLLFAIVAMFVTFGMTSLVRALKLNEQSQQELYWSERARMYALVSEALVSRGLDPKLILPYLITAVPAVGKDGGLPGLPAVAAIGELVDHIRDGGHRIK